MILDNILLFRLLFTVTGGRSRSARLSFLELLPYFEEAKVLLGVRSDSRWWWFRTLRRMMLLLLLAFGGYDIDTVSVNVTVPASGGRRRRRSIE